MRDQEIIGLWEAYQQVHSQLQEVEQFDEEAPERIRKPSNRNKSRKMLPGYPARLHNPKPTKMDEEAVENWVNSLIEEGYDLSDYTWDDMCKMYMSEERRDPDFDKMERQEYHHTSKAVKQSGGSRGSSKNRSFKMSSIRDALKRGEDPRADGYGGARAARGNPPEDHRASFSKNPLNNPPRRVKKAGVQKESFDLFDTILEHLVAEGYADTNEGALVIMANMSEEWRDDIVEKTAMSKRGYDETEIRNKIAKSTGGGETADRATALASKKTYGQRGVNPQAREKLARTQRGDFRKTTSSSPGLHGYAHKSDDPEVKEKQAARGKQRSALTPKEKKELNR